MIRLDRTIALAAALALTAPFTAGAEPPDTDRFSLRLGVFLTDLDTGADISRADTDLGTDISLEGDLGLDRNVTEFRIEGDVRLTKRNRLFFGYVEIDREASALVEGDVTYGDVTFAANSTLELSSKTTFTGAGWRYDVVDREAFELGLSLGLLGVDVNATLTGEGTVDDGSGPRSFEGSRSAGVSAPAPLLGVHFDGSWNDRFILRSSLRYMAAELDDLDGALFEGNIRLEWYFAEHFGVGLGLTHLELTLDDVEEKDLDGSFEYDQTALFAHACFRF